jgi:hypothetical protein
MGEIAGWDQIVEQVSVLVLQREKYQGTLGKLAKEVADTYGVPALKDLAEAIKETHGVILAVSTLKNYRWVYEKTSHLNLPEDLSYVTRQYIATSGDPEGWARKIIDAGLSGPEAVRLIRESKGLNDRRKKRLCPSCGATFYDDGTEAS